MWTALAIAMGAAAACVHPPTDAPPPDVIQAMADCDRYHAEGIARCAYDGPVLRFVEVREPEPEADMIDEGHVRWFLVREWCVEHTHLPGRPLGQLWYTPLDGNPFEVCCDYVRLHLEKTPPRSCNS